MSTFKDLLSNIKKNFYLIIFSFISAVILVIIAYYVYKNNIINKIKPEYVENKEFINKNLESGSVDLYYFFTKWCPHCSNATPIWEDLKETTPTMNNVKINYISVDCEKEKELAEKFNIEGYPTIILINKDKQKIEYDAKPNKETLELFLKKFL
tara:strand:+ start:346 stop:807 length:462 start_codon:yes stop_codon:yes gene_type:complete